MAEPYKLDYDAETINQAIKLALAIESDESPLVSGINQRLDSIFRCSGTADLVYKSYSGDNAESDLYLSEVGAGGTFCLTNQAFKDNLNQEGDYIIPSTSKHFTPSDKINEIYGRFASIDDIRDCLTIINPGIYRIRVSVKGDFSAAASENLSDCSFVIFAKLSDGTCTTTTRISFGSQEVKIPIGDTFEISTSGTTGKVDFSDEFILDITENAIEIAANNIEYARIQAGLKTEDGSVSTTITKFPEFELHIEPVVSEIPCTVSAENIIVESSSLNCDIKAEMPDYAYGNGQCEIDEIGIITCDGSYPENTAKAMLTYDYGNVICCSYQENDGHTASGTASTGAITGSVWAVGYAKIKYNNDTNKTRVAYTKPFHREVI